MQSTQIMNSPLMITSRQKSIVLCSVRGLTFVVKCFVLGVSRKPSKEWSLLERTQDVYVTQVHAWWDETGSRRLWIRINRRGVGLCNECSDGEEDFRREFSSHRGVWRRNEATCLVFDDVIVGGTAEISILWATMKTQRQPAHHSCWALSLFPTLQIQIMSGE